jgi:phosphocarrier protein
MPTTTITLVNKLGLHARAAAKFVNLAKTFSSTVSLAKDGSEVDGKSIMNVMLLAAPVGSELTLRVEGEDEQPAFESLLELVNDGFGELD